MKNKLINIIHQFNYIIENTKLNEEILNDNILFLPLVQYMEKNNILAEEEISKLLKKDPITFKKLKHYNFKEFHNISDSIENYLSELTDEILNFFPQPSDTQSIYYLLYEILINIYKHSKFTNAYIQINNSKTIEEINICIIDDGIGIPGSFRDASIDYASESECIYNAINGNTTDKEKYALHGRGLNSSARITTLGFHGEMLIASCRGICYIDENGAQTYSNENIIEGTFIVMRINNKSINNIYEYLKYKKINKNMEDENERI